MRAWTDVAVLARTKNLQGGFVAQSAAGLPFLLSEGLEAAFVPPVLDAPRRAQVTARAAAPFAGAALTGYEIHTGRTAVNGAPFCTMADGTPEGCVEGNVFGTYLHGLFDSGELTEQLAAYLCRRRGIAPEQAAPLSMETYREQQFDRLADGVRRALDMDAVYAAMGLKNPKGASL